MNKWQNNTLVLPAWAYSPYAKKGMELVDTRRLGMMLTMAGGAAGFNSEGDLPSTTVDGVDVNQVWSDYQATLEIFNAQRTALVQLLSYNTTLSFEQIGATGTTSNFEEASEFGEPVGIRVAGAPILRAYDFKWYDLAARYTWRFLLKASTQQLDQIHNTALEADNRLLFDRVFRTIFNPTNKVNSEGQVVHKFWNGVSVNGETPRQYKSNTFVATHNHYLASNIAGVVAKGNPTTPNLGVEDMYEHLRHHGYTTQAGYKIVLMANSAQTAAMRTFRANVVPSTGGLAATYDFIPATDQPGFVLGINAQPLGVSQPSPNAVPGVQTIGTYGNIYLVEDDIMPPGYMFMFATRGGDNLANPIAIRSDPRLQGLRLIKGRTPDYPLIDSFYTHGLGSGIKNKSAGVLMQVVASTSYTPPTEYATP